MICERLAVVVVPFPFTDSPAAKRRPAVVLSSQSFNERNCHSVMAMVTSATEPTWTGDAVVTDLLTAGLNVRCIVRLKLFTLDNRLIIKTIGHLAPKDADSVIAGLRDCLGVTI